MVRIHIVGSSPRSGTTLLFELIKFGFCIDCCCQHEARINSLPANDCKYYLTKKPSDFMVAWLVLAWVKDIYVISIVRDPRDSVSSKRKDSQGRYWCSLKFWKLYTRLSWLNRLSGRFIEVKYEDLCHNPRYVQKKISNAIPALVKGNSFDQFGGESAAVSIDAVIALNGVRPLGGGSIGVWKGHLDRVACQVYLHGDISSSLIKYGYEQTDEWKDLLPPARSVNADRTVSTEFWTIKQIGKAIVSALSCIKRYWLRW